MNMSKPFDTPPCLAQSSPDLDSIRSLKKIRLRHSPSPKNEFISGGGIVGDLSVLCAEMVGINLLDHY